MGCTEPPNTEVKESIEGIDDIQDIKSQLMNDDGLSNLLELHIECQNLKNMDIGSISDPLVVVSTCNKNKSFKLVYLPKLEEQKKLEKILIRFL